MTCKKCGTGISGFAKNHQCFDCNFDAENGAPSQADLERSFQDRRDSEIGRDMDNDRP